MPSFIDQTGRELFLAEMPRRIISLVPSQTELLYDLGLREEVVGITKFCVHPEEWFHSKTRVGGTKELKIDIIQQLNPDLIIANKEENVKEQVEALAKQYPVWISDVNNLDDAYEMIYSIGGMVDRLAPAREWISGIRNKFSQITKPDQPLSAAYLVWQKPHMTVGRDTFIHSMMEAAGFQNIFGDQLRYPETTIADLQARNCQLLLLSSEPFPFKQKHIDELQALLPETQMILVDGEMFSWYGTHLLNAPAYFQQLFSHLAIRRS